MINNPTLGSRDYTLSVTKSGSRGPYKESVNVTETGAFNKNDRLSGPGERTYPDILKDCDKKHFLLTIVEKGPFSDGFLSGRGERRCVQTAYREKGVFKEGKLTEGTITMSNGSIVTLGPNERSTSTPKVSAKPPTQPALTLYKYQTLVSTTTGNPTLWFMKGHQPLGLFRDRQR